jgi:3-oxoacyl-[acyl-carrier-protein] synthase II
MSTQNGRRRVVITGLGGITPCGNTIEDTWTNVRSGRSGVSRIDRIEVPEGTPDIAGQVKDFDPLEYMDRKTARKTDRFAQLAVAAATQAVGDADLDIAADAARIGCSIGTGIGGLITQEVAYKKLFEAGPDRLNPFWVTALISNMGAAETSMALGTRGPLTTETTACAASGMSLGNATLYIRAGMADAMLAGGVESPITLLALGGFGTMRALSRRLTTRRARAGPSTSAGTASSSRRARPSSSSRSSSGRRRAARGSTPRCWATGCRRTPTTSPSPIRSGRTRLGR